LTPTAYIPAPKQRVVQPFVVLIIALILTGVATYFVDRTTTAEDTVRFNYYIRQAEADIKARTDLYRSLLRSGRALHGAEQNLSLQSFRKFVATMELSRQFPGIQGVGFLKRFRRAEMDSLRQSLKANYDESIDVHTLSTKDEFFSLIYIEPQNTRNRNALGFDPSDDPIRRDAMMLARDTGYTVASGKVYLKQEIDSAKQAGFVMYLPIYRGGIVPATVEERREKLDGFISGPFRADDLLQQIFDQDSAPRIGFRVYDGVGQDPKNLLHVSAGLNGHEAKHLGRLTSVRNVVIARRPWTIVFQTTPAFERFSSKDLVPFIFTIGSLMSILLYVITRSQSRARSRVEHAAWELQESQKALEASEARLRRLVESNVVGIAISETTGLVLEANDAYLKLIGRTRDELRSGSLRWDNITPAQYLNADRIAKDALRQFGKTDPYEKVYLRPDGSGVQVLVGLVHLGGNQAMVFAIDQTERKEHERELQLAKEMAELASSAKDQFLAVLSHELRTPLTPILTTVDLLENELQLSPEVKPWIEIIRRNVELEARLIDDLLDITRIARGKIELHFLETDAHRILDHVCEIVGSEAKAKDIYLHFEKHASDTCVLADSARLQQIYWNLVKNSIKFTPTGGEVRVSTSNDDEQFIVEVSDTGIGIDPGFLPVIFDAFEQGEKTITRQFGGLGLGLAITKNLVNLHEGTIKAESAGSGRGATFTVALPLSSQRNGKHA
jgi:PAS domain S-box-containing protein